MTQNLRRFAALCAAIALVFPWFTFSETFGTTQSSESWALSWGSHCSDFARDAIECRYEFVDRGVEWLLLPLFVLTRFAAIGAAVGLLLLALGRVFVKHERLVAAGVLMVFAIHFAAVPGDMQYRELKSTIVPLFALLGASALLFQPDARLRSLFLLGATVATLASALWLPWSMEREVVSPADPQEQSAYSYGTLGKTHHWHSFRNSYRHHMEDAFSRELLAELRLRDVRDYGPGVATALAGLVLAWSLLTRLRDETRARITSLVAAVVFGLLGVVMSFTMHTYRPVIPSVGAALALLVVLGVFAFELRSRVAAT